MNAFLSSSIFFGLVAMGGWGVINVLVSPISKKIGPFRAALLIQVFALIPTVLLFPFFKKGVSFNIDFWWLSILGIIGAATFVSLTKALAEGSVSIVAPLSSSWAIITAILSFIFLKEELFFLKVLGIIIAVLGVILVSADFSQILKEKRVKLFSGTKWAYLAALGWGVNYFLLAFFSRKLGWYFTNLGMRFWCALSFLVVAFLFQKKGFQQFRSIPRLIWVVILLDVFTFMMFNIGLVKAEPAVVSVIGSASPLVSVVLAYIFFKEKISSLQKIGVALVLIGIASLSFA